MNKYFYFLIFLCTGFSSIAQPDTIIKLPAPDLNRGEPVMKALTNRSSTTYMDTRHMSLNDISDILWAANGINRPESGKRTAASAINAQDVDVYLFLKKGAYIYNPKLHQLELVTEGDHREILAGRQEWVKDASQIILLVSDTSRFTRGDEQQKLRWAWIDCGIVSQNIMLLCASEGFLTRPRAIMEHDKVSKVLGLNEQHIPVLNLPVSYEKEEKD